MKRLRNAGTHAGTQRRSRIPQALHTGYDARMPVSVITGATSGIGRWIALGLARAGHQVVMIVRDQARGEAAVAWIRAHVPDARIDILLADLSSLAETRRVGSAILQSWGAVDVLVNNAGIFSPHRTVTTEGLETVIAVNHLSPFVLTASLLPALRAAKAARIVNIGSSTADRARIDPADLLGERRWGMVQAYGQSKLALTMATMAWARRLHGGPVVANVVHPGAVATGLVRAGGPIGLAWRIMAPFLLTPAAGADTPLHVALAPEFAALSGAYVKKRQIVRPNPLALDPNLVEQLWDATEALAGPVVF